MDIPRSLIRLYEACKDAGRTIAETIGISRPKGNDPEPPKGEPNEDR